MTSKTEKTEKPEVHEEDSVVQMPVPTVMMALPQDLFQAVVNILMDHTAPRISFSILKELETKVQAIQVAKPE